jgi:hypothetical protein
MKYIFFTLLFFILFTSCDIPGTIYIKNKSGADASFLIQKKDPGENLSISRLPNGDEALFNFGFGQWWTNGTIRNFSDDTEKLEIITQRDTLVISDKSELITFLKKRRSGIFKNAMKIVIR